MSGIGGFLAPMPITPVRAQQKLEALARGLKRRGDAPQFDSAPSVGLVFRPFDNVARTTGDATCRLLWDGRLDNGAELGEQLGLDVAQRQDDGAVVLAAYRRWPENFAGRLIGDFALALWDSSRHQLLLARDLFGVRPLFYALVGDELRFASTLEALLESGVPRDLDSDYLLAFLLIATEPESTPYRAIRGLAPGFMLIQDRDGRRLRRVARIEARAAAGRSSAEREEEFRELFGQAVRRRLRTSGSGVGLDLSGGVDSSSIVCEAVHQTRAQLCPPRALHPVSIVYRESAMADESRFMAIVEDALGLPSTKIYQEDFPIFADLADPFYEAPSALFSVAAREREIARHLRAAGAKVHLRGFGGDQLLWSENYQTAQLADLLQRGRLITLLRSLGRSNRDMGEPYLRLLGGALYPLLPQWLRARFGPESLPSPPFLRQEALRRAGFPDRFFWPRRLGRPELSPSDQLRQIEILDSIAVLAGRSDSGPITIDAAYPFFDRDLVELCLGLPFDELLRPGQTRSIHRRALAGRVPERVLERKSKATVSEAILKAIRDRWPQIRPILADLRLEELGLVDGRKVRERFEQARFGHHQGAGWRGVLTLEVFLRHHERAPALERAA